MPHARRASHDYGNASIIQGTKPTSWLQRMAANHGSSEWLKDMADSREHDVNLKSESSKSQGGQSCDRTSSDPGLRHGTPSHTSLPLKDFAKSPAAEAGIPSLTSLPLKDFGKSPPEAGKPSLTNLPLKDLVKSPAVEVGKPSLTSLPLKDLVKSQVVEEVTSSRTSSPFKYFGKSPAVEVGKPSLTRLPLKDLVKSQVVEGANSSRTSSPFKDFGKSPAFEVGEPALMSLPLKDLVKSQVDEGVNSSRRSSPFKQRAKSPYVQFSISTPRAESNSDIRELSNPRTREAQQLQPPVGFQELYESMKSLHGDVSQMSLSMRSIIHDELDKSMKTFLMEQSQIHDTSMKTFLMEQSQMRDSMRTIVREEFEQSIKSLHVEEASQRKSPKPAETVNLFSVQETLKSHSMCTQNISEQMPMVGSNTWNQGTPSPTEEADHSIKRSKPLLRRGNTETFSSQPAVALVESRLSDPLIVQELKFAKRCSRETSRQNARSKKNMQRSSSKSPNHRRASCKRTALMVDELERRDNVRETLAMALLDDGYNVEDLYSHEGLWQSLARHDSWFSSIGLIVIALNVLWIGVDEDINHADVLCNAPVISQIMNNAFCIFFTLEVVVHFMAFENKINAFKDPKFLFDLLLAVFMVWETWVEVLFYMLYDVKGNSSNTTITQIFRFFRLFRLTRVPRIVRLSMAVPELLIMMRGIATAMRSVMAIVVFLIFAIFVFSILFTELLRGSDGFTESFTDVPSSMYTLLLQVICGVDSDFLDDLLAESIATFVLYMLFLFVATYTLMNMLVGVLCDVVSTVGSEEKENMHVEQLQNEIGAIARSIDRDGDGVISKVEFEQLMKNKETLKSLDKIGVDVVAFGGLEQFIFRDDDDLTLREFCDLIAQFRGSRAVTVKDLVDTHKFITMELDILFGDVRSLFEIVMTQKGPRTDSQSELITPDKFSMYGLN